MTDISLEDDSNLHIFDSVMIKETPLPKKIWKIKNIGEYNLVIDSIKASCECVMMEYDLTSYVKRGGYFMIGVSVKPDGITGPFLREVEVFGNFMDSPLTLIVEGLYYGNEL